MTATEPIVKHLRQPLLPLFRLALPGGVLPGDVEGRFVQLLVGLFGAQVGRAVLFNVAVGGVVLVVAQADEQKMPKSLHQFIKFDKKVVGWFDFPQGAQNGPFLFRLDGVADDFALCMAHPLQAGIGVRFLQMVGNPGFQARIFAFVDVFIEGLGMLDVLTVVVEAWTFRQRQLLPWQG